MSFLLLMSLKRGLTVERRRHFRQLFVDEMQGQKDDRDDYRKYFLVKEDPDYVSDSEVLKEIQHKIAVGKKQHLHLLK